MTETLETRLTIESWDEKPYREFDDGRKFTTANVTLTSQDGPLVGEATWAALMYYAADGTSTYVGQMQFTGTLGGRTGSFVMQGQGGYDGKTARLVSAILAESGTGDLAGITGSSECVSTHADYPLWPMALSYTLD